MAAGRGTASAVGAAASGLALGAGGEHLQGYWIKPQLNEETKYGAGTNAVNMNYFKQAFAKPPQGPFYCFRIGIPLPALFVHDIHTGKMQILWVRVTAHFAALLSLGICPSALG